MIRPPLIAVATAALVACSNDQTDHSKEELARSAYHNCLKSAAAVLRDGPLSIEQIGNQAGVQCEREREMFTQAMISKISNTKRLTCDNSEAKIPCDLRDSFERRFLKSIGDEIATARGFPVEKELEY